MNPYCHAVAFRKDVLDPLVPIRKRPAMACYRSPDAVLSAPLDTIYEMTYKIWRVNFVDLGKIALVSYLSFCTQDYRLVLFYRPAVHSSNAEQSCREAGHTDQFPHDATILTIGSGHAEQLVPLCRDRSPRGTCC